MAAVELRNVEKWFGDNRIIPTLSLGIRSGEFVVFVGPSGCGKSTLLRIIAGLEPLTNGEVLMDGRTVNNLSPKERGIAMVFQNYALYPHMTVFDNLAFSLRLSKRSKNDIATKVQEVARLLGIEGHLTKKPHTLSGGQKQRVAIGRAMVRNPKVFLFDEPLSNLDAELRARMRTEIALLHRKMGCTSIYVTHDQIEAMTLADRIVVLRDGHIEQVGSPIELYENPKTQFVASFIGAPAMNFLPAKQVLRQADTSYATLKLPANASVFGIRPDKVVLAKDQRTWQASKDNAPCFLGKATVTLIEPLGSHYHIHLQLNEHPILAETRSAEIPACGDEIDVGIQQQDVFCFDSAGLRVATMGGW